MNRINAHDFAAVIATLITQPEAFGRLVADDDYEDLLVEFGEILARFMKIPMVGVIPPEPSQSGYTLVYQSMPTLVEDSTVMDDVAHMVPIEPHRASMAAMLHALAERVR